MTTTNDIHAYLAEFDDIPGTRVYTAKRARMGYHMNQFAMSLMKAENRERFKADERAYIEEVLRHTGGQVGGGGGASEILGLPVSTLRSRMKKLGIRYVN